MHTEDEEQIRHALDLQSLGQQNIFVVRLKKTMAYTVRSQEKVDYQVMFCATLLHAMYVYSAAGEVLS